MQKSPAHWLRYTCTSSPLAGTGAGSDSAARSHPSTPPLSAACCRRCLGSGIVLRSNSSIHGLVPPASLPSCPSPSSRGGGDVIRDALGALPDADLLSLADAPRQLPISPGRVQRVVKFETFIQCFDISGGTTFTASPRGQRGLVRHRPAARPTGRVDGRICFRAQCTCGGAPESQRPPVCSSSARRAGASGKRASTPVSSSYALITAVQLSSA